MRTWTCSEAAKDRRPRPRVDGTNARAACSRSLPLRSAATFTTRPPVLSVAEPFSLATHRKHMGKTQPDATQTPRAPPPRPRQRPTRVISTSDARQPSPTVHVRPPHPPRRGSSIPGREGRTPSLFPVGAEKGSPTSPGWRRRSTLLPPPKLNASSTTTPRLSYHAATTSMVLRSSAMDCWRIFLF